LLNSVKGKKYKSVFKVVNSYNAFQDNPWPLIYKTLDKKFPG